jgi:glycine cleavage system H protein
LTSVQVPDDLRYSPDHEWLRIDGDEATVGITEYAATELGDVVFVELPAAGTTLDEAQPFGVIESVKTASDLYAPAAGEVLEINARLTDSPELVNDDPYGEGWMVRLRLTNGSAAVETSDRLMDAEAYRQLIQSA